MWRNVNMISVGAYLPSNKVYNEYFVEHFNKLGLKADGLMKHLGRRKRYLASDEETSLTMAYEAAKRALIRKKITPEELDMIVFVSDTPEYLMPTNAIKLVEMLNAENANTAFDLNGNCAGMLIGVDVVSTYMKCKKSINKALVVGSFHVSASAKEDDTIVYANLADAAAAVILEGVTEEEERGYIDSDSYVDSSYHSTIVLPKCGMAKVYDESSTAKERKLQWNPFEFDFLSSQWAWLIQKVLNRNRLTSEHIDYYVFSQLSDPDNLATLEKLGVNEDKYFFVGKEYAYTGNTCPFLLMNRMWEVISKKGNNVIFCSVGAGYTINVLLFKF